MPLIRDYDKFVVFISNTLYIHHVQNYKTKIHLLSDKMLTIFEYQHSKVALLDKQSTVKEETVLHLAADEGLSSCVKRLIDLGADLSMADYKGNTVLHRLTIATDENQRHTKRHLEVFDTILEMVVKWWCKKEGKEYPEVNSDNYTQLQKKATLHLIYQIQNNDKLSVIALSFKLGAFDIIYRLLMMRNVTMFKELSKYKFDISSLKPLPKKAGNGVSPANDNLSGLERLFKQKSRKNQAAKILDILDIPPVKMIERYYNSIVRRTYFLLMFLHVVKMIIFTNVGIYFSAKIRDESTEINSLDPLTVFYLCVVASEPFIIGLVLLCRLIAVLKSGNINCKCGTSDLWQTIKSKTRRILEVLYRLTYITLVIIWIVLFVVRCNIQDYILAAALCFGWLHSIMLMRGFKKYHYLFRMLISMILRDFSRFAFVYVFVLFAFSSAFHVLFQISPAVLQIYGNLLDTLFLAFNLMTGRGELFDEDFKTNMNDAGRELTVIKMYYIVYVLLSSIILINLLIAMMNDSYRKIFDKKHVTWRIDSVILGFDTERMLCDCLRKKISKVSIKRGDEGKKFNSVLF